MNESFAYRSADYPAEPGVYLMKDLAGKILYVGKAKDLRKRLASYFRPGAKHTPKTRALVGRVVVVDVLLTSTEKEALLLEESLIKKHRPRYNIVLRDDKRYLLFRLDKRSEFPRLTITRKVTRDGSVYYGPFTSAAAARQTFKVIGKLFPLRKCSDTTFANRVRPCLYHDIGQCPAPCVKDVDTAWYRSVVRQVEILLAGRPGELVSQLASKMRESSDAQEYEEAARYRDLIEDVRKTVERQAAVTEGGADLDVVALAEAEKGLGLGLVFVRKGRLLDEKKFYWPGLTLQEGPEALASFLAQFYTATRFIPGRILIPHTLDEPLLGEVLADRRGARVGLRPPSGSSEKRLLEIARKVAARAGSQESDEGITVRLRRKLRLSRDPVRIECVDISHLGGEGVKAGQVVFEHGKRVPEDSRLYAFPDLEGTSDDYAALHAWALRRAESGAPWPDLVLVDGGKGQLAAVVRGFEDASLDQAFEMASIAKGPSRRAGELEDRIFRPGRLNPMGLKPGSVELLFLQKVRDAAHRFAIGRQRKGRVKKMLQSEVLNIPGVGPKTARLLWDRFGSLDAMLEAELADIQELPGIGKKKAGQIHESLADLKRARKPRA